MNVLVMKRYKVTILHNKKYIEMYTDARSKKQASYNISLRFRFSEELWVKRIKKYKIHSIQLWEEILEN